MRDLVARTRPDLLDAVVQLVDGDPFERVGESTRYAQPAIFCASLAGWSLIEGRITPRAMAGHSLGELSALAAANAIADEDALRLVVRRAELMADAGEASGGGTMLALVNASPARAEALAARHGVVVANDNAPGAVVCSGAPGDLDALRNAAENEGLKALSLDVAGAFHSPQMAAAVEPFREALAAVRFRHPDVAVVSCATAQPFRDPANELAEALVRPVRWRATMTALAADGIGTFVDAGPGRVLAKLVRRNVSDVSVAGPSDLVEGERAAA
jgi:malonyl CoA-acyl carrier protein transacylase